MCLKEKGYEWDLWKRGDIFAGIYKRKSRGVTNHKLGAKGGDLLYCCLKGNFNDLYSYSPQDVVRTKDIDGNGESVFSFSVFFPISSFTINMKQTSHNDNNSLSILLKYLQIYDIEVQTIEYRVSIYFFLQF